MTALRNRSGFALLAALLAISIVTALMLAALLRTDQNAKVASAETLAQRAFAGAEGALWGAVSGSYVQRLRAEQPGAVIILESNGDDDLTTKVTVTKIDTAIIWIVADATVWKGIDQGHRRLGLSATLPSDTIDMRLHPVPGWGWVNLF